MTSSSLQADPILEIEKATVYRGDTCVFEDLSFTLQAGVHTAILGPNGAGKSTLLRAAAGAHKPHGGRVIFDDIDVTSMPAHRRVSLGIALVPEGRRLFPSLTVEENLRVAAARRGRWNVQSVLEVFPLLQPRRHMAAANLSGGEQQAVAIGRALMSNPRLLLLDEVSLGLAPIIVDAVYRSLAGIISEGRTVLLVEQDLTRALNVAGRVICLLEGRIVLEGEAASLDRDRVVGAYFGLKRPA